MINLIFHQSTLTLEYDAPSWFMLFKTDLGFGRKQDIGLLGSVLLDKFYLTTYIGIAIYIILSVILYKTSFGLRLRSCGKHPQAAAVRFPEWADLFTDLPHQTGLQTEQLPALVILPWQL